MKWSFSLLNFFLLSMLLSGTWIGSLQRGLRGKLNCRKISKWTSRLRTIFWWWLEYGSWISHKNKQCFIGLSGSSGWTRSLRDRPPIILPKLLLRECIRHTSALLVNPSVSFFSFPALQRKKTWRIQAGPRLSATGKSTAFIVSAQWRAFKTHVRADFACNLTHKTLFNKVRRPSLPWPLKNFYWPKTSSKCFTPCKF